MSIQRILLADVTAASVPLPPETGSLSMLLAKHLLGSPAPHQGWRAQHWWWSSPLGARGKCLESFQLWRPSLAGEWAGAHCHQGLVRWHGPWLFLYQQCTAPDRTCSRILGWKHRILQSKPCSKPGQSQSQSRMLRAMLRIFHAGDATTSLGTTPGLHNSCWSHWS